MAGAGRGRTLTRVTSHPATGIPPGTAGDDPAPPAAHPSGPAVARRSAEPADHADPAPVADARAPDVPVRGDERDLATPPPPDGSPPLVGDDPSVRHRLQRRVIAYWRWRLVVGVLPAVVLLGGLAWVLPIGVPGLAWAVIAVALIVVIVALLVLPPIRYRVFWFAVSPSEIDIQHGIIFVKRTVVPLERVQSLRTERGPIADYYGMASLHIRTAGGSVNISGLRRSEADELCTRISRLTELADNI